MRVEVISEDALIVCVRSLGDVTEDAYSHNVEPLAVELGPGIYRRAVLIDLGGARFIDSRGVGWLLKCHKRFRENGGVLVLHSMTPEVAQVLKILRMDLVLDMATDEVAVRARATSSTEA